MRMSSNVKAKIKKYSIYAVIFVLGSASTLAVNGQFNSDDLKGYAELTSRITTTEKCSITNCDLSKQIVKLHDEVGRSSWTLDSLAHQNAYTAHSIVSDIKGDTDSSWTLEALSRQITDECS